MCYFGPFGELLLFNQVLQDFVLLIGPGFAVTHQEKEYRIIKKIANKIACNKLTISNLFYSISKNKIS